MTDHLLVARRGGVATLTMNRPEARNALSMEMRAELNSVLHEIELDEEVRCVVLEGAGDHFMAGGDVKGMFGELGKSPAEKKRYFVQRIHDLHPIMFAMRRMPKPIVAKVRGLKPGSHC